MVGVGGPKKSNFSVTSLLNDLKGAFYNGNVSDNDD